MTCRATTWRDRNGIRRPVFHHSGHAPRYAQPDTTIRMLAMPTKTKAVGTSILNSTVDPRRSLPERKLHPALSAFLILLALLTLGLFWGLT